MSWLQSHLNGGSFERERETSKTGTEGNVDVNRIAVDFLGKHKFCLYESTLIAIIGEKIY